MKPDSIPLPHVSRPVLPRLILVLAATAAVPSPGLAAESVIYHFKGGTKDGAAPYSGLILDKNGALYGTAVQGGNTGGGVLSGDGIVFKLTPPASGKTQWIETVLYLFKGDTDGLFPYAGLKFDEQGALYGTTGSGGGTNIGGGTVFKLIRPFLDVPWNETVLYRFRGGTDGSFPYQGSLIRDKQGALYGTTYVGGGPGWRAGGGTVFKLTPPATGKTQWTETVLYRFKGGKDGFRPPAGLVFGKSGALYGLTSQGGTSDKGIVFQLAPPPAGQKQWTKTVLYSFQGGPNDGAVPFFSTPIFDKAGALYGTTALGGAFGHGTIFKLTPPAAGQTKWTEKVLYSFRGGTKDGTSPNSLIFDKAGVLYGTTMNGGTSNFGTVYKLTPPAAGKTQWTETVLHSFVGKPHDGREPIAGLLLDKTGTLYGTTAYGGLSDKGTVFKITGAAPAAAVPQEEAQE